MLLLTTTTTVQPLYPNLDTFLMTDASRLFGFGFALFLPKPQGKWLLIQCGSASLTPTQTRYTKIELECKYYLRRLPTFKVWTDHRPLVSIFQKNMTLWIRDSCRWEKVMQFEPVIKWVLGKTHYIANALSRLALFNTNEEGYTISCNYQSVETGTKDVKYQAL